MYDDELIHYGVKGMKWGVRRHRRLMNKAERSANRHYRNMYVKSYNRAADSMNNGGIDRFNSAQRKKYGKDYAERKDYTKVYEEYFNKEWSKQMEMTLSEFYENNRYYRKAKEIANKYGLEK